MSRWLLRGVHLTVTVGFLFAGGLSFLFASNIHDTLVSHEFARRHGELVNAQVYASSFEPQFEKELFSMNGRIGDPYFIHLQFETRKGFRYRGAVQVDEATHALYSTATPTNTMLTWVCVPRAAQDQWVLLTDAVAVEAGYRWHRNTSLITGAGLLFLALLSITATPLIRLVHRADIARVNRTPGPYGIVRTAH